MKRLIAVDWGTSSLRAALMQDGVVVDAHDSSRGILAVEAGGFAAVLQAACGHWMDGHTLTLMCGMAGSRQGWIEAPYCPCPAGFAQVASRLAWVATDENPVAIVPGLSHEKDGVPDVMRGEETQIFGALGLLDVRDGLFVLPGTHSKWAQVRSSRIHSFDTFMTGEFYALLRSHSILARTLPGGDGPLDQSAFRQGLEHARTAGSLLRAAFSARTLALFGRMADTALPSYLSGMVIGEELRLQPLGSVQEPVIIIGSDALTQRYEIALRTFGAPCRRVDAQATWRGLWDIAQTLENMP